jgi:hypothetical protein
VRLREFLCADKNVTSRGVWADKKMPKTGGKFPLSKNHSYRLGLGWRWRVVELSCEITDFRLLIAFRASRQQYIAALGVVRGYDTLVLASLEYHATHAGWHVHGYCGDPEGVHWGRMRYPDMIRLPAGNKRHRRMSYSVDDISAVTIAASFFRIEDLKPDPPQPATLSLFP